MMKISQIRELSSDELKARSREIQKEMLNLRIQKTLGQLENKCAIRNARRERARILTILTERKLGINTSVAPKGVKPEKKEAAPVAEKKAAKKPAAKKAPKKK